MTKKYIISALYIFMLLFFINLKLGMEASRDRTYMNWMKNMGIPSSESAVKKTVLWFNGRSCK